jgi:nitroreductase
MHIHDAIRARRAVKQFDAAHRMSEGEIQQLMELARLSPTAFNIQHWRFVLVTDAALKQQIRAVSWDQAQVTDCSLLVILCADVKAWAKNPARYWQTSPQKAQEMLVPAIGQYYTGQEQAQRDEAMRSCGMAAQTLMLAAQGMGYDTCPMDGFDFEAVARLIHLPEDHLISMFVAIGKKIAEPHARPYQLPLEELVITNRFA